MILQQPLHQIGADEPGGAGHDDAFDGPWRPSDAGGVRQRVPEVGRRKPAPRRRLRVERVAAIVSQISLSDWSRTLPKEYGVKSHGLTSPFARRCICTIPAGQPSATHG